MDRKLAAAHSDYPGSGRIDLSAWEVIQSQHMCNIIQDRHQNLFDRRKKDDSLGDLSHPTEGTASQ
jgi:hypothetical protein